MRLNHESLRSRLWTIAAGSALGGLACSASPSTSGPSASATAPAASSAPAATPAKAAASGSPFCAPGGACVPGSMCSYLDGKPSDMGPHTTFCRCDGSGQLTCPASRLGLEEMVCIPKTGPTCQPFESPGVTERMTERMPACPGLVEVSRVSEYAGGGQVSCCYHGRLGTCQGRPLRVGGRAVVAARRRGAWG